MSGTDAAGAESRTIAGVQASTRFLLDSFKAKMRALEDCAPEIKALLRFGVDFKGAASTAERFFGSDTVGYIAIDGTNSMDQQLDLIVFYVGAFAYSGTVTFREGGVEVGTPRATDGGLSASAAIPLSEEDAAQVFGQKRESGVEVDPERLPNALMHMAEYYLAFRGILGDPARKIVLVDRTMAGDVAHLVWSTRDLIEDRRCILEGLDTPYGKVTALDLELARMLLPNDQLATPTPRSQLLKFAAVLALFGGEALTPSELVARLGADPKWTERLNGDLLELDGQFGGFEQTSPAFKLKPGASDYWDRVLAATLAVASHVFAPEGGHPLRVKNGGSERWVTADDLDFMVLVLVRALVRKAWSDRVLPIGFIKDTNAFELVKAVVPILCRAGLIESERFPNFNSDKMLLQTNSVVNAATTPTPWYTPEIDASFRTMAPRDDPSLAGGEARVNGAFENVIYQERVYLKSYVQLWSSESTPSVRSHVFTYDRPVYPGYDHWDEVTLFNKDGPADVRIHPVLHFQRGSDLTNVVMAMLAEMAEEVIPEALGHNYPLFLADKKAKSILEETRQAYLGAVAVEMAKSDLDQQVLFSRRFRDYRSQIEGRRRGG
ncbi:MAG: hypothetical protein JRN11_01085 [Nitrososphaerota archaeon]|nr:hypothetical protein [Nitrososphaerota archaeon]MDG7025325.1 hypothetical protein [Nitrososphaerota archaeon]